MMTRQAEKILRTHRRRAARSDHADPAGQALPEKYRFILFEDKREVELVWNGKTRDVCTTVLPFQTLEHIDEPRTETKMQGRALRQPRPPASGLDQQADLGRQQADPVVT